MATKFSATCIGKNCKKYLKLSAVNLSAGKSTNHQYESDGKNTTLVFSKTRKGISINKKVHQIGVNTPDKGYFISQADFETVCAKELAQLMHQNNSAKKESRKHKNYANA